MEFFIDVHHHTLTKFGEELPGDMVNVIRLSDCCIVVMADGLGSGVKANILATLTSRIASTMLKEGTDIYETVNTIVSTLPVCKVRNIAYSTFTLLKIYNDGSVYLAEYDNPCLFFIRDGEALDIEKREINIDGKLIREAHFNLEQGDTLVAVSDGVIHAGLGNVLNLGWQWKDVKNYLKKSTISLNTARDITEDLLQSCWSLYYGKPGDDTTVVSIRLRTPSLLNLFTGPPKDKEKDKEVIESFMESQGKKVICGGTAANIAERELNRKLKVNLDFLSPEVPPTATMEGIDLITEGVLTLSKVLEKLKMYSCNFDGQAKNVDFTEKNGVSMLMNLLIGCTHLNLWVGKAVNPAHQNPDFPIELSIKLNLVEELCNVMKELGKIVSVKYI